jgi:hypothetical protein
MDSRDVGWNRSLDLCIGCSEDKVIGEKHSVEVVV